ncbi:hypothetical protein Tco_1567733, partial [Tanacetum coccineum]
MDVFNQSVQNVIAVQLDLGKFRREHDKEMDTYIRRLEFHVLRFYTNTNEELTSESQEAAARVSELEKNLCQLQNKFRHEEIEEKQIQADTDALSIELNKARAALIPLQYQLHDHQFELQFQSNSKRILSEM